MAEITDLSELTGDLPSEDEIHAIIRRIDITIVNIINGKGTYGGVDYRENGQMGFDIAPSNTLNALIKMRKMYVEALSDPTQYDDVDYIISQYDNPGL